ncbi:MAG: undecaprenyl-diphosphatase [Candidatus Berkelbacteria bacterium Licking1014_85]|uniref:Undecaprenyl-diphosphatase n=1 Tax=Candidatus Berkelbacteria bacterium Licking1014_85 TaxID=2017148 RepID=A0A554LL35_9BACT|nr:MAG: undecaprenyl-diphosphatase [Candidatus Berkelbacteria bacterium Licking1014_85]
MIYILLGIIQGIAEFLPISSTAHLILAPYFFNFPDPGLSFDIMLHLGTLLAIIVFFWRDWFKIFYGFLRIVKNRRVKHIVDKQIFYLACATIPAAILGYALDDWADTIFRKPLIIAIMLFVFAIILYISDKYSDSTKTRLNLHWQQALIIGCAQAFAIIPGVSRSGATISAGRFLGLSRTEASKFSFLLSAPIILGAALGHLKNNGFSNLLTINTLMGFLASFIFATFAIKWLLGYVNKHSFGLFVWYRIILAGIILILAT